MQNKLSKSILFLFVLSFFVWGHVSADVLNLTCTSSDGTAQLCENQTTVSGSLYFSSATLNDYIVTSSSGNTIGDISVCLFSLDWSVGQCQSSTWDPDKSSIPFSLTGNDTDPDQLLYLYTNLNEGDPQTIHANVDYTVAGAVSGANPTIIATLVACDSESDLPNWSNSSIVITSNTATDYIATHSNCHLESGWSFQSSLMTETGGCTGWDTNALQNGDTTGLVTDEAGHCPWVTFGPTDSSGNAVFEITSPLDGPKDRIWVREALKTNYIPFSLPPGPESDVSAEMWCDDDVKAYDDGDAVTLINPSGKTYYCIAFNALDPSSASGSLNASPNPCTILQGNNSCVSNISVSTSNVSSSEVFVSVNGGPEQTFMGPGDLDGASKNATLGLPPTYYNFYLYDYSSGSKGNLLAILNMIANVVTQTNTQYSLTVTKTAGGSVKSTDNNIICGNTCSADYDEGSNVTLTATPDSSYWRFVGWSGDCSGAGSCSLIINSPKSVTAIFSLRQFNYIEF